jgi:hypothetical protein
VLNEGRPVCNDRLSDDETVCIRIPASAPWYEPAGLTSANFKLDHRTNERGISVYRESIVSHAEILSKPDAIPGSLIATATVGDIRRLVSGLNVQLNLDVVPDNDANDPGHCEIYGPTPGEMLPAASKALKRLFKLA